MSFYRILKPLLFNLEPEQSHRLAIRALMTGAYPRPPESDPMLRQNLLGLDFPNPLGIAAGFDKNAEVPDALLDLGFGFAEIGSVTPQPQAGNPKPRIFRAPAERALVNRLGFNNEGFDSVHRRLSARSSRSGIVGVNIGANKDSTDRTADYVSGITRFADVASYFAINISSPNTPGLRDFHNVDALRDLLMRVLEARNAAPARVPLLLKVAPDLDEAGIASIAEVAVDIGVDGLIATNTTVERFDIAKLAHEAGGLSGQPLFDMSTTVLAKLRRLVGPEMVIIGLGGVNSAETALSKLKAGANLVQFYTGMVYEGPGLAGDIVAGLPELIRKEGAATIGEIVGSEAGTWAARPLP